MYSIRANLAQPRRHADSAPPTQAVAAFGARTIILILLAVGLFYLLVVGLRIRSYSGNISALIDIGEWNITHQQRFIGPHVVVFRVPTGYDGVAYYLVAGDPFLRHPAIREPFRYQRIGYPLAVWAVSLGRLAWRPYAMAGINLVATLAIAVLCVFLLAEFAPGASPWWALAGAINTALIIGVEYDLAEPMVFALSLGALLLYLRRRVGLSALAFAAALLTREVAILFLLPIVAAEVAARRWRHSILLCLSVGPYLLWQAVLIRAFGNAGTGTSEGNLGAPLAGIAFMLREALHASLRSALAHQGIIIALVVFVVAVLVVSLMQLRRRYDVVVGGDAVHAAVALLGAAGIWTDYLAAARVFGGMYPLTLLAWARYRTRGFYAITAASILITLYTFFRLVAFSKALPYYLTP